MNENLISRIKGRDNHWKSRPFSGGYAGLRDLVETGFSGAVTANDAWLFMLNGRVIGIANGTLMTFKNADGSAYVTSHPSLPLLFAMLEQNGKTRARYYTEDTPLSNVHETLSDGTFTGYIELSENVISGDYYVVYYGDWSMSIAFLDNDRLLKGEQAFERAEDEIGIYEVVEVTLEIREIPDSENDSTTSTSSTFDNASTVGSHSGTETPPKDHLQADERKTTGEIAEDETDTSAGDPTPDHASSPARSTTDTGGSTPSDEFPAEPALPELGEYIKTQLEESKLHPIDVIRQAVEVLDTETESERALRAQVWEAIPELAPPGYSTEHDQSVDARLSFSDIEPTISLSIHLEMTEQDVHDITVVESGTDHGFTKEQTMEINHRLHADEPVRLTIPDTNQSFTVLPKIDWRWTGDNTYVADTVTIADVIAER